MTPNEIMITQSGAPTEAQMREQKAPWPKTIEELTAYIRTLVDRPHDYGTCVYAMSLASVATFNYVAGTLGVTGFQESCADLDILRQTRDFEWGKILNYENLLYPQYCNDEHFPPWRRIIADNISEFQKRANVLIAERGDGANKDVIAHWRALADGVIPGEAAQ